MRVLWFSNSRCGSARRNNGKITIGGWLISLEDEIKKAPDIELSVSFVTPFSEKEHEYEGVKYFPVSRELTHSRFGRFIQRYEPLSKYDKEMLPLLLEVVKKVNPDIIHIHGTEECFGLIQDVVKDIPIVFSIQGLIAPYTEKFFSGLPDDFMKRNERIAKRFAKHSYYDTYKSFVYRSYRELHYLRNAKYVIGRTHFDHNIAKLCNQNVKLFQGEEILRKEFYLSVWDKDKFGSPLKIVSTISGGIYKGYETALHASWLLKQYASFDFEWQIIGYDNNDEWVKYSEKYKKLQSNQCGIKFYGRLEAEEMVNLMRQSDVYVQVSHIENSPNCLCEAMILGMPIIASFAGGTSSMIQDSYEGQLVQDGDPYVLAGSIVNLISDFEKAKAMGVRARERALQRHNPTRICQSIYNIYNCIISENEIKTNRID